LPGKERKRKRGGSVRAEGKKVLGLKKKGGRSAAQGEEVKTSIVVGMISKLRRKKRRGKNKS